MYLIQIVNVGVEERSRVELRQADGRHALRLRVLARYERSVSHGGAGTKAAPVIQMATLCGAM